MSIDKRRWTVLILQILIGTATSFAYVLAVFVGPMSEVRGWDVADIVLTFTVSMWIGCPAQIIAGKLRDIFGNKKCIIVGGALYGIAIVLSGFTHSVLMFIILEGGAASFLMFVVYTAQLSNVGGLFPDRRGFAIGLVCGGMALGGALLAPIAEFLISSYSAPASIVIQGVAYGLIVVICGILLVNAPEGYKPEGWEPSEENVDTIRVGPEYTWRQMMKTPAFYLILLTVFCLIGGGMMLSSNGSLLAQDALGVSTKTAAWIVSLFSVGLGFGAFIFGSIADKIGGCMALGLVCVIQAGLALIWLLFGGTNVLIYSIAVAAVGCGYGSQAAVQATICMNTFGRKNFGINNGLLCIGGLLASLYAPQYSATHSAREVFLLIVITSAAGIIVALFAKKSVASIFTKWLAEREDQSEEEPVVAEP